MEVEGDLELNECVHGGVNALGIVFLVSGQVEEVTCRDWVAACVIDCRVECLHQC